MMYGDLGFHEKGDLYIVRLLFETNGMGEQVVVGVLFND